MATEQQIGHFTVRTDRPLGVGGFGRVLRAHNNRDNRDVALKILNDADESFRREADAAKKLHHEAIVRVYDTGLLGYAEGNLGGVYYVEMQLMTGGSLADEMERGYGLSPQRIYEILYRVASALDYAHSQHIIHRDIKPANILFDGQGKAYVADFGIARPVQMTATMSAIGTPGYMSPEQIHADRQDERTDIYLLGVMLFQMLTGQLPYHGKSLFAIQLQHVSEPVPAVSKLNPKIPKACDRVVAKAMAKDKNKRYASAGDLVADYARAAGLTGGSRAGAAAFTVIGLILLVAGVWWWGNQGSAFGPTQLIIIAVAALIFLAPWLGQIMKFSVKLLWLLIKLAVILVIIGIIAYLVISFLNG